MSSSSPNERTHLLKPSSPSTTDDTETLLDANDSPSPKVAETPLDYGQITALVYARLVEPIAFFSIFPFVNKMIFDMGVKEEDVGFYSGLIESLFSLTQMIFMIPWGIASDRFGRRPVLITSLFGISIGTFLFGFSTSVWQMIFFRCLAGMFAGVLVTLRTMFGENSDKTNQARAFSYFAFGGNVGIFMGPLVGGALSDPVNQYPRVFGNVELFKRYPYALPTICTGTFALTAAVSSLFFVKETLNKEEIEKKKRVQEAGGGESKWTLLASKEILAVILIYGYVMLLAFAYTATAPVFWFTDINLGGFGFTPFQISLWLGLGGLSQAAWILLIFPPLQKRIGTGNILRLCTVFWPIFFSTAPVLNLFLRKEDKGWRIAFYVIFAVITVLGAGVSMAFTAVQLAINDVCPTPTALGVLNGISLTFMSGIRAVIPATWTSLYAVGVGKQILGGELAWVILIGVAVGCLVLVWTTLPKKVDKDKPTDR